MNTATVTLPVGCFDYICGIVRSDSGIVIEAGKDYLVDSRLGPLARRESFDSIDALVAAVRTGRHPELRHKLVEAMTTNETTFFRDTDPFDHFATEILPRLIEARRATRHLRIWYAASSTGQEPYSISMLIRERFPELHSWTVTQYATDYCRPALERARKGRYSQVEVNRGLPAPLLVKYFTKRGIDWELSDDITRMVQFSEMNLNAAWPASLGPFDVVFIRNVMIYFDLDAKKRILGNIHGLLTDDGYMFLGAAETTFNLDERFVRADSGRAGCYKKAPSGAIGSLRR